MKREFKNKRAVAIARVRHLQSGAIQLLDDEDALLLDDLPVVRTARRASADDVFSTDDLSPKDFY